MTPWKTVRVFISSTFRDMHAERDYLVHDVFLELRERCARRQLHLIDVDLRWGVTEEEEKQGKVLEICLDEIERCRPFFIGILGERYGGVPANYALSTEKQGEWLKELESEETGLSVTALEILYAVLRSPSMQTRAFFYFRDPSFLKEVPSEKQNAFLPETLDAARKLESLKDQIRKHSPVFENYPCSYAGLDASGLVKLSGLQDFGARLLNDLWEAIKLEYPEDPTPIDETALERSYHEAFVEGRAQRFIGRRDELADLIAFAESEDQPVLVVYGPPGCGKSALLAKLSREYSASHSETFLITHFFGTSPGSTDVRRTLLRLCRELAKQFSLTAEIPTDYHELRHTFERFLVEAAAKGRVVLVLDALNQLDDSHYSHTLDWLPRTLPARVKIIASTTDDSDCLQALLVRQAVELSLDVLPPDDRRELVTQTLKTFRKHLSEKPDNDQMGLLLSKQESGNPLYLVVVCEEMRVFGEFERVTERIAALPGQVEALFQQVLERIEEDHERVEPNHGRQRVRDALSLLECSRHGLLESEMLELLARVDEQHLPQAIWARLYRSLKSYLRPTRDNSNATVIGEGTLDFFHQQLSKAVRQRYLTDEAAEIASHQRLAKYFKSKADPRNDQSWTANYPRAFTELSYHLLAGRLHDELFAVARDVTFRAAQSERTSDPELPLQTLQHAISGSAYLDDAPRMAEFILSHARTVQATRDESPLDALREGHMEKAWRLADLFESESAALWYLLIAWQLKVDHRVEHARETLNRLQRKALPLLEDSYSELATHLLSNIFDVHVDIATNLQTQLLDDRARAVLCEHLCTAGFISEAAQLARSVESEPHRSKAFRKVAIASARAGHFHVALQTAQSIEDGLNQAEALRAIVAAQLADPQFANALETTKYFGYAWNRDQRSFKISSLRAIALAQAKTGDSEGALGTAKTIEHPYARTAALFLVAIPDVLAGRPSYFRVSFAAASESAREIPDPWDRVAVACAIAVMQARVGETDKASENLMFAFQTAQQIGYEWRRVAALCEVAQAQIQAKQIVAADKTLTAALLVAQTINAANSRESALALVASARSVAESAVAQGEVQSAEFLEAQSNLLSEAELAASVQNFIGALSKAANLETDEQWTEALNKIVTTALEEIPTPQLERETIESVYQKLCEISESNFILLEERRSEALCAIATSQAHAGDWDGALKTTKSIENMWSSDSARREIAITQAGAAHTRAAMQTVDGINSAAERAATLCAIAVAESNAGQIPYALETFQAAVSSAMDIVDEEGRRESLEGIITAQTEVGQFHVALNTAQKLDEPWQQIAAIRKIAVRQARAGELKGFNESLHAAIEIASTIHQPAWRASELAEIASAQAEAGDIQSANETVQSALKILANLDNAAEKSDPLSKVADVQIQAGDFQAALQTIKTIPYGDGRHRAVRNYAIAQTRAGDFQGAMQTMEDPELHFRKEHRVDILCEMAIMQARAGDAQSARNSFDIALTTAKSVYSGGSDFYKIALAQSEAGHFNAALQTANLIEDAELKPDAVFGIGLAQIRAAEFDEALESFRTIKAPEKQSEGLRTMAKAYISSGSPQKALQLVDEILTQRNERLIQIAADLVKTKGKTHFKELLIPCAYYLDSAYQVIGLLTGLYLEQSTAVASLMLALDESDSTFLHSLKWRAYRSTYCSG